MEDLATIKLGNYLTLKEFCTCTSTFQKYSDSINPYPQNVEETLPALSKLFENIIDPIIENYGKNNFRLTYGFCSIDLKKYLAKKDPLTGEKNGRVAPQLDQHMALEVNSKNKYFCFRGGASCDFYIQNQPSDIVIDWIIEQALPFDSLYFYGSQKPIHISYGPEHKKYICGFNEKGVPSKKPISQWLAKIEKS